MGDRSPRLRQRSLGTRSVLFIVLLCILLAGVMTAITAFASYRRRRAEIRHSLSAIENSTIPTLTASLWEFDMPHTRLVVRDLAHLPFIAYASVRDDSGDHYSAGLVASSPDVTRQRIALVYRPDAVHRFHVGQLILGVDYAAAMDDLWAQAGGTLISQLLVILLMAGAILTGLHFSVARNLKSLAQYAATLSLKHLNPPPQLSRLFRPSPPDEFDVVSGALDNMRLRIIEDLHTLHAAEEQTRKLSRAVEEGPAAVMITDRAGTVEYVNRRFSQMTGFARDAALGAPEFGQERGLLPRLPDQGPGESLLDLLRIRHEWRGEVLGRTRDGTVYWQYLSFSGIRDEQGHQTHFLAIIEDITELKTYEDRLLKQRTYDSITGLPNRLLSYDRLSQAIRSASQDGGIVALLTLDIDGFSAVNEAYSMQEGDGVLRAAAERLRPTLGAHTVARTGSDEFQVILDGVDSYLTAENCARDLARAFASPFRLRDTEVALSAAIGIALFPNDGKDPDTLIRHAGAALQEAKRHGGDQYRFYMEEISDSARLHLRLSSDLRHAVSRGEIAAFAQRIVASADERCHGAEALIRWHHGEFGLLSPAHFMDIAEANGTIHELGQWMLDHALQQVARTSGDASAWWISVNVSPHQFVAAGFADSVRRGLERYGVRPGRLKLEVTEQVLLGDQKRVHQTFEALHELGVDLSLDDFGTGYSALSYLNQFRFDSLKIDKSFIDRLNQSEKAATLVTAMIELAHRLGLTVVAEGIETSEQAGMLRRLGCDYLQGYLYARPRPIEEFDA